MECHKYIFYLWIFWSSFNWFFFGNFLKIIDFPRYLYPEQIELNFIKELLAVNKYLNIFMDLSHYSCYSRNFNYLFLFKDDWWINLTCNFVRINFIENFLTNYPFSVSIYSMHNKILVSWLRHMFRHSVFLSDARHSFV